MYSIKLEDGHHYHFNNYRKIRTEHSKEGVEILVIEIQYKPRQRYKTVRMLPMSIKSTTLSELKKRMMGLG